MVDDLSITVQESQSTVTNHLNKLDGTMQGKMEDASAITLKRDKHAIAG